MSDGGYATGLQASGRGSSACGFCDSCATARSLCPSKQRCGTGGEHPGDSRSGGYGCSCRPGCVLSRGQSQYKNAYNSQYQPYPAQAQPQYVKSMGSRDGYIGALPLSAASNAPSNATQYYSPVTSRRIVSIASVYPRRTTEPALLGGRYGRYVW